jgi:hypothetical protein
MSEAPRVELSNTDTDFDLSAPTNPFQQTANNIPDQLSQMDGTSSPQTNGNGIANKDLQNSAIKAKNGILESEVSGTRRSNPYRDAS